MAWIRVDQDLVGHPKLVRLARRLGVSRPCAVGIVVMLWCWATAYHAGGDLSGVDAEDVADACHWDGDPAELLAALMGEGSSKGGFIDADMRLHGWGEFQHVVTRVRTESGKYGAHVRHHERAGLFNPDCEYCVNQRETTEVPTGANVCQLAKSSNANSTALANASNANGELMGSYSTANSTALATSTSTSTSKNSPPLKPPLSLVPSGETFAPDGASHTPDPTPDDGFDAFWAAYPERDGSKGSKAEAKAAWGRLSKAARGRAMTAVGHYAAWCDASGRYPKDAVRFIRPVRGSKTALFEEWQEPRPVDPKPGAVLVTSEADRHNPDAWSLASLEQP